MFIPDTFWFQKNPHRNFRVRPAIENDHSNFYAHGYSPAGRVTVIKRDRQRLVVVAMPERFGRVIDSDMYALGRVAVMHDRCRRDRLLADLTPLRPDPCGVQ
jgi:hypothetical protein